MADFDFSNYEMENVITGEKKQFSDGVKSAITGCIKSQTHEPTSGKIYSILEGVLKEDTFFDMFITPAVYKSLGAPPPPVYKAGDPVYEFFKSKYTPEIQAKITAEKRVLVFKTNGYTVYEDMPIRGYYRLVPKSVVSAAASSSLPAPSSSAAPRRSTRGKPSGGKRKSSKSRRHKKSKSRRYRRK